MLFRLAFHKGMIQMDSGDSVKESLESLAKVKCICRIIGVILKAVLLIACAYWSFAIALMAYSAINPEAFGFFGTPGLAEIILYLFYDAAIAMMLVVFIKVFSDVSKGESPFTFQQVKRLRILAALLLLWGFFDIATAANASILQYGSIDAGFYSTSGNMIIPINFTPFISAAVVFAFSFVFKYGVLLQDLSDETL